MKLTTWFSIPEHLIPKSPVLTVTSAPNQLTLFLNNVADVQSYSALEILVTVYPLPAAITADQFRFEPFEDYVSELTAGRRSTYHQYQGYADKVFGLCLSAIIASVCWFFFPSALGSVEAIVAVLGAYAIGKELWQDLDRWLQQVTQHLWLAWSDDDYVYVREDFGTIQRFWQLARRVRYGYQLILPSRFDLLSHSNSKTIEMSFDRTDLDEMEEQVRILTIPFAQLPVMTQPLKKIVMGYKVNAMKTTWWGSWQTEMYQGSDQNRLGTIDTFDRWHEKKVTVKTFWVWGKIKVLLNAKLVAGQLVAE